MDNYSNKLRINVPEYNRGARSNKTDLLACDQGKL